MKTKNEFFPQWHPHPGRMLDEKLQEMGISPEEFSYYTNVPVQTINAIINGKSAITPDIAAQFERVTLIPTHCWLNYQKGYDEYINRVSQKKFAKTRQYRRAEECIEVI